MRLSKLLLAGLGTTLTCASSVLAQNVLKFNDDSLKATAIGVSVDTVRLSYDSGITPVTVMSNKTLSAVAIDADGLAADWFRVRSTGADRVVLAQDYSYSSKPRSGILRLTSDDGVTRDVPVVQVSNSAASTLRGDTKLTVTSATDNQHQGGEEVSASLDGDFGTMYSSPWGNGTRFPVILTYNLRTGSHVDYLVYHPRTDGNINGNFGEVTIEYTTADAPSEWKLLTEADFGESSSTQRVSFGEAGVDDVRRVRFTVHSGGNGFATCSEMEFYEANTEYDAIIDKLFSDNLCTTLQSGITADDINNCGNSYFRQLGLTLLNGGYTDWQRKFRIGTFECYETVNTLASRLKTSTYNSYENPTGIFFRKGQSVVLFVEGIGQTSVALNVHDFGNFSGGNDSSYPLKNGINVITPTTTGNGYIKYYAAPDVFASAPDVRIHFALADVNGYFDMSRGDTNEDWKYLLDNACSNIVDLRTPRLQVAFPTDMFRQYCPENAVELAQIYDDVVRREREVLGLIRYNEEPKNRQFARIAGSGMFADGTGAGAADPSSWMLPSRAQFGWWGLAHELGHTNQVRPSFNWTGLGETTNNIYAAWVEFCESEPSSFRLECEVTTVFNSANQQMYSGSGARFNCYLQQNVCEGATWQFANGPDYYGAETTNYTLPDQDEDGNVIEGKNFTGPRRNYDHFVKLPPLWQLQLYGTQAGFAPDIYAKVIKGLRGASDLNSKGQQMTNGQQLMRFVRTVCDSTRLNFIPFFEKAGMFMKVKRIIEDYSPGLLCVSEKMLNEVRQHVEEAGYPLPEGEVNYISGLNWQMYKDRAEMVTGDVNQGCTRHGTYVTVDNDIWQNTVAFETYDASGKMIAITMYGLGHTQYGTSDSNNVNGTDVLFPAGSTEIKAVSWDGKRVTCYQL